MNCLKFDIQVKEYKDGLIKKAENLITIGFPEKIVRLNELLETDMFANRNLHDVHQVNKMISNCKRINSVRKLHLLF